MKNRNLEKHYKEQISYFGKEFSKIDEYKLKSWQIKYINWIKKYLLKDDFKGKKLMDIGTGEGYVAIEMARLGLNIIACDLTKEALINVKRTKDKLNLKNIKLLECKADEIPIRDKSVDYIVANAVLEHIPNEKKAINEWKRILKPKGRIMVTVPLELRFVWPFLWLINILHDRRLGHLHRYDKESLRKKFNMEVEEYFYTGHIIKVLGLILSMAFRTDKLLNALEKIDSITNKVRYGASNVVVFLRFRL